VTDEQPPTLRAPRTPRWHLYGVQDETGRAVVEALDEREVTARRVESRIDLVVGNEVLSTGYAPPEAVLTLHTWPHGTDRAGAPATSVPVISSLPPGAQP
jgi:hypothetical protein